jgi:tRNA (mo5U34)-methyltransferase
VLAPHCPDCGVLAKRRPRYNRTCVQTASLYDTACLFWEKITELKARLKVPFEWYLFNTLANIEHLDNLLEGGTGKLPDLCRGGTVLDIGCADGDWAFFLESLGCKVHALDCPITNHNGMAGVHRLKKELGSNIEIFSADLDGRFTLPSREYQLVFFLGTLYHLKNPFYILSELAKSTRYCLMSTRIARTFHPRFGDVSDLPVAYLVGKDEINADPTNFWIFSPTALTRLLKRSHWDVLKSYTVARSAESNPWSIEGDERMFCLLESTYGLPQVNFVRGWHQAEDAGWRWTEQRFSAVLEVPPGEGTLGLAMEMYLPDAVLTGGPVMLSGAVDGTPLAEETLSRRGYHTYLRQVPPQREASGSVTVEFSLDKALAPDDQDCRERGVIVASLKVQRRT